MTTTFSSRISRATADRQSGYTSSDTPSYTNEIAQRRQTAVSNSVSVPSYDFNQTADSTLTVGRGIRLVGEISACEKLVVDGYVEAEITTCKALEVTSTGVFKGRAEIDTAIISGEFSGDLLVRHRLSVQKDGRIEGSIQYRELELEPGALIKGTLDYIST